jgi:hypothetical protein
MNMKMIYAKMRDGDWLDDEEVLFAYKKFNHLAKDLAELGDVFHLAKVESIQRANQLRDWHLSRTGKDLYDRKG